MVIGLPADALANVRFRWSMLGEVPASLKVAERPGRPPWIAKWWHDVRPKLPPATLRFLRELAPAPAGSTSPDFLYGATSLHRPWARASLDEELHALVTTTSDEQVCVELADAAKGHPGARIPAVPRPLSMALADRGADVYLEAVAAAISSYCRVAIQPYWGRLRSGLDREVDRRREALATHGVATSLASLSPYMRLQHHGDRYQLIVSGVPCRPDRRRRVATGGLDVTTSAFLYDTPITGPDISGIEDCYYPARNPAEIWQGTRRPGPSRHKALAALLGRTRATVFMAIAERPCSTSELAARACTSLASASQHATVLRDAGLISTRREGTAVRHELTGRGSYLLVLTRSALPGPRPRRTRFAHDYPEPFTAAASG